MKTDELSGLLIPAEPKIIQLGDKIDINDFIPKEPERQKQEFDTSSEEDLRTPEEIEKEQIEMLEKEQQEKLTYQKLLDLMEGTNQMCAIIQV